MRQWNMLSILAIAFAGLAVPGCGESTQIAQTTGEQAGSGHAVATAAKSDDQPQAADGWWCAEHGVPEEVCAQCDQKLVADFKAKGDWCKKHDRPESQCFLCHPELEAKFAAQYEAKYGKKPPKPQGDGDHEPKKDAKS